MSQVPQERDVLDWAETLIDVNEVAARLRVAKGTIYQWVYQRQIPFVKVRRCVRFDWKAIEEWLRRSTLVETGKR